VLDTAPGRGDLGIAAPVFAELLQPSRAESFLDSFYKETGIAGDWNPQRSHLERGGPRIPVVRCSSQKAAVILNFG
jgi:hypothetical protein